MGFKKENITETETENSKTLHTDHNDSEQETLKELKAKSIINVIPNNNSLSDSLFFNMCKNLENYYIKNSDMPHEIMMPFLYALRFSYAGMYAQGLCNITEFNQIQEGFYNRNCLIGLNLSKEEQIKFQEESFNHALDWINHNYGEIHKYTMGLCVLAAQANYSLKEILNEEIYNYPEEIVENLKLDILDHNFCLMFFKIGGWMQNNGKEDFKEKAIKFLFNSELHPYTLLLDFKPKE